MKYKLVFILGLALPAGCDTRHEWLKKQNTTIQFLINGKQVTESTDTVKFSDKIQSPNAVKTITVRSAGAGIDDTYVDLISGVSVSLESVEKSEDRSRVDITLKAVGTGESVYAVKAVNTWGGEGEMKVIIRSIRNLRPVASLVLRPVEGKPLRYVLDASGSKDLDDKWGGKVKTYQYTIDDKVEFKFGVQAKYTFGSLGQHAVKLVVYDNDGEPSEAVTEEITIK